MESSRPNFEFIEDLEMRVRLQRLYLYIEKNDLRLVVDNIRSSYDNTLDNVFVDLGYNDDFQFSVDMSHIRSIVRYGWSKYLEELHVTN